MTEIYGWRAFHAARTAKHFRKFVRIVKQAKKKYKCFPLKNIKLLVLTPPSLSACAHFWCFNWQQHSFSNLQLVLKICSNFISFAATFHLQQLYFICINFLICSMFHVGHLSFSCKHRSLKRVPYFLIFVIREVQFLMSVNNDPLFFRFLNRVREPPPPCTILYLQLIPACKMSFFLK